MSTPTPVGAIFADPAGVGGTLTRRRPAAAPAARGNDRPAAGEDQPSQASSKDHVSRRGTSSRTKTPVAAHRLGDTIVYVTPDQAAAVRAERRRSGRTTTEIVLTAVEEAAPHLAGAFSTSSSGGKPVGQLFVGSRSHIVREPNIGRVQLCLRMIQPDRDALDRLAADADAPSRSHLIRKALDRAGLTRARLDP